MSCRTSSAKPCMCLQSSVPAASHPQPPGRPRGKADRQGHCPLGRLFSPPLPPTLSSRALCAPK
eukprot:3041285-Lingulodinium_polyedra.AAC.1